MCPQWDFLSDDIYPWKPGLPGTEDGASLIVAGAKWKVVPKRLVVFVWGKSLGACARVTEPSVSCLRSK